VTFKEFKEEDLRVAEENNASPDLTHVRVVKDGDSLPLMCYRIYGDARYYMDVARTNGLVNFRSLTPGTKLVFPPFDKQAKTGDAR
jgi:nucleoid-associated protein YgaU